MEDFRKKVQYILHLNINIVLPKIDEIVYIVKQSNASITRISEFELAHLF